MRVTLVDSNTTRGKQIAELIQKSKGLRLQAYCNHLTSAFTSIEKTPPNIAFYAEEFARKPEFDTMLALGRCLSVKSVVFGEAEHCPGTNFDRIDPKSSDDAILRQLSSIHETGTVRPAIASAGLFRAVSPKASDKLVLLGASTGGIDALLSTLGTFPRDCPPTLVVQHTGTGFGEGVVKVINSRVEPKASLMVEGATLEQGKILISAGLPAQVQIEAGIPPHCSFGAKEKVSGHCPSVDAMFHSAVPMAKNVVAVLLTGMGRDGAEGLLALRRAGAQTICQDEESCVVYGMPRVAVSLGAAQRVLPLPMIGSAILSAAQAASS